jgi:tRNA pseudouridine55 synthase
LTSDFPILGSATLDAVAPWLEAAKGDGAVALIDKAENWTSFDCVAVLRNKSAVRRVGHAGTLDPLATGLLILCFGKATKRIDEYQAAEKEYVTTVKLGATTATDDRGAEEHIVAIPATVTEASIHAALQQFVGTIEQIPPAFSAIRHGGKRQYDLARQGKTFEPRPRSVVVHSIDILDITLPFVTLNIRCSKGTYIRSIARDLGTVLGTGGYAHSLRRTRIGSFLVQEATTVDALRLALSEKVAA